MSAFVFRTRSVVCDHWPYVRHVGSISARQGHPERPFRSLGQVLSLPTSYVDQSAIGRRLVYFQQVAMYAAKLLIIIRSLADCEVYIQQITLWLVKFCRRTERMHLLGSRYCSRQHEGGGAVHTVL